MSDDYDGEGMSFGGGIFPFLSILFCLLGALSIILFAGSLKFKIASKKVADKSNTMEYKLIKLDDTEKTLASDIRAMENRLVSLKNTASKRRKEIKEMKAREKSLTASNDGYRRAARDRRQATKKLVNFRRWKKARTAHDEVKAQREQVDNQVSEAELRIRTMREKLLALENDQVALKDRLKDKEIGLEISGSPPGKKAVFIELGADHLAVLTDGLTLASGTKKTRKEVVKEDILGSIASELGRPEAKHYALFLLRPGSEFLFKQAAITFNRRRIPFAKEPVETGWRLNLEQAAIKSPETP